jgi:thioredoxin 1
MREVTDASFEDDVLRAAGPVVVDFWAPWCGPCRAIHPILEQFEQEQSAISFVKLNVDENMQTAARYNVLSIPTVMLFEDGEPRETVIGARPRAHFERAFERWLAAPAG